MTEELKVTHADRDLSVTIRCELSGRGLTPEVNAQFLRDTIDGAHDDDWMVQAIAEFRHRTTTESSLLEALKEAREALNVAHGDFWLIRRKGVAVRHCMTARAAIETAVSRIDTLLGSNSDG